MKALNLMYVAVGFAVARWIFQRKPEPMLASDPVQRFAPLPAVNVTLVGAREPRCSPLRLHARPGRIPFPEVDLSCLSDVASMNSRRPLDSYFLLLSRQECPRHTNLPLVTLVGYLDLRSVTVAVSAAK